MGLVPNPIRILFFKAIQHALFDAPIVVPGHTRPSTGTFVAPYASRRKKRLDPPRTRELFGATAQHPARTQAAATARPEMTLPPTTPARQPAQRIKERMDDLFAEPKEKVEAKKPEPRPVQQPKADQDKQPWEMTKKEFGYGDVNDWPLQISSKGKVYGEVARAVWRTENPDRPGPIGYYSTPEAAQKWVDKTHRRLVKEALRAGQPVPAAVLADYPDLNPKAQAQAQPAQAGGDTRTDTALPPPAKATPAAAIPQVRLKRADLKQFTARGARSSGISGGVAFGGAAQDPYQALGLALRQAVGRGKDQYVIPTAQGLQGTGDIRPPMTGMGSTVYLATASGELWDGTWGPKRAEDWTPGQPIAFKPTALLMQVTDLALPSTLPIPPTPPPEPPFQPRTYRIKPAADLAAALQNGDLAKVMKVLEPLSLQDTRAVLLYAGFSLPVAKTKPELIAKMQSPLLAAAKARKDGFDMHAMRETQKAFPVGAHILFFKAGPLKNRPGLALQTVTTVHGASQRWKRTAQKPLAHPQTRQADPDPHDQRGSAHGYGTHDLQPGSTIQFKVGDYAGKGVVSAVGSAGVTAKDAEGRPHRVHFHEITHHQPGEKARPTPGHSIVLGPQKPIPAASFVAADYAKSHDQADVTPEKILAGFPPDTTDRIKAAQDRLKTIEQTIDRFKQDGKWNAQRELLHHKIIAGILSPERVKAATPPPGQKPTFILLGGRGGSGKSSLEGRVYDKSTCIVLDADAIKKELPEYEGWNAHQVHEESGELFDKMVELARTLELNVVLDKTMKTAKSAIADVKAFKAAGYRTEAHYMHLPRQEAAKRAVKRFLDGGEKGRYVPIDVVLSNTTNEASFDAVKPLIDRWSFRDNNVPKGNPPILISESGAALQKSLKTTVKMSKPILFRSL